MKNQSYLIIKPQIIAAILLFASGGFFSFVEAAVAVGATRIIYPEGQKQVQLAVTNNNEKSTYLIQSWVESEKGQKDSSFVVTPPLFSMKGKKENTLRIIDATNNNLPKDRETLFWMNVKAIPSMDRSKLNENTLQIAIVNKIKLFYRPSNLSLPPDLAPSKINFGKNGDKLILTNPTPYYLTVTELTVGSRALGNTMIPPMGQATLKMPSTAGGSISYRTINDYGALTSKLQAKIN